jgi:primary-amine oxidase
MANELTLGCDCLGQIHYMVSVIQKCCRFATDHIVRKPGSYVSHDGTAVVIKNVICIHEEDAGLLWKHTDFRPGGRGQSVRSRRLVVSMVVSHCRQ